MWEGSKFRGKKRVQWSQKCVITTTPGVYNNEWCAEEPIVYPGSSPPKFLCSEFGGAYSALSRDVPTVSRSIFRPTAHYNAPPLRLSWAEQSIREFGYCVWGCSYPLRTYRLHSSTFGQYITRHWAYTGLHHHLLRELLPRAAFCRNVCSGWKNTKYRNMRGSHLSSEGSDGKAIS